MRKVLIIVLLAVPGLVMAATPTPVPVESTMDLALHINDLVSVPVNAKLTIHVINKAPANKYDHNFEPYSLSPDPITPPTFKGETPPAATTTQTLVTVTSTQADRDLAARLTKALAAESDETKVPAEVAALTAALGKLDSVNDQTLIDAGQAAIQSTQEDFVADDVLTSDEGTIFTIHRGPVGALAEQTWIRNFHVGGPGRFVSNYVFGFAPRGDEQFFSKASDPPGKFTITRTVRRDKVSYVPLVLFSWIPASKGNQTGIGSWAAGLGYDLSNLVVAGSYLWTWHRNLGITAGVMAQKQQRLKGTYHQGDVITTNLQSTDLTEAVWRPNVFVGISIRSVSALFR